MQVCRHCGWENPEIAAFCTNCGTGLGRGRPTGPRFRALGLSGEFEEVEPSSVDAAWPTSAGKLGAPPKIGGGAPSTLGKPTTPEGVADAGGSPLAQTLVDFPAPELEDDAADAPSGSGSALVPPPRHAAIARRTTGPVLLPDEAASSVDIGPLKTEAIERVNAAAAEPQKLQPAAPAPEEAPEAPAPAAADEEPHAAPAADDDGDAANEVIADPTPAAAADGALDGATVEQPADDGMTAEQPTTDDEPITEPHPVIADGIEPPGPSESLEEDGFDEFIDPDQPSSVEDVEVPDGDSAEIEIASPEDSLGTAIDDFARDADDVRIEPPSDAPESLDEFEDELELSTSDLHTVDLSMDDEPDPLDPGSTHPAMRAMPPPLPAVSLRYVLRPFSQRDGHRELVPIADAPVVIGRSDGDVHVTDDDFVSPRHARFSVHESQLMVDDLDSLNGVWLRVRVDAALDNGDEFLVGQQLLRIESVPGRTAADRSDGTRRLGIAANGRRFRIAQLADDGAPLDVYHLPARGCRIGRRLGDIVFTEDTFMSGTHALLMPRDGAVTLRDLSSRNGCWVRIRGRQALETGDAVMIGRTVWRIGRPVG